MVKPSALRSAIRSVGIQRKLNLSIGRFHSILEFCVATHLAPRLVPQVLERDQRPRNLVVGLDDLLGVLGGQDRGVGLELAHGLLDAFQEVPAPHDVPRHGRHVPADGRVVLVLLVQLLHRGQVQPVVVEDDRELAVQVALEVLPLQDVLELLQQRQRALDAGDGLEGVVDEGLQSSTRRSHVTPRLLPQSSRRHASRTVELECLT